MTNQLVAAIFSTVLMFQTLASASADSFIRYPWACPNLRAHEEANEAFVDLDEDAFENTGCVSIRPGTEYRILRCDPDIQDKYLEKFDYVIERSIELTSYQCEISVTIATGRSDLFIIDFAQMNHLTPRFD